MTITKTTAKHLGLATLLAWGASHPALASGPVFASDVVVQGSLCVGFDCPASPGFGFSTILMMENNTRIRFQDTSTVAGFPSNDWQLTANGSNNGGNDMFLIEDVTGGKIPFTLLAGAPSNAVYIDTSGDLGLGTNNPLVDIHAVSGNTPTLRLEQNGSSGFTPQTWDIAGNEANFFVRDATHGSKLPFKIKPDAPTSSIFVKGGSGDIGLGTEAPDGPLHVSADSAFITLEDADNDDIWYITHQAGNDGDFEFTSSLNNGATVNLAMSLQPDGDMTIDGTLTQNSDKNAKMAIEPVQPAEVLAKLAALDVAEWSYIDDTSGARHIGPMAQDFYALFGLGATETGISTLDTSGVALAAIQALMAEVETLSAELQAQRALVQTLIDAR